MPDKYNLSMTEFLDMTDVLIDDSEDDYVVIEIEKRGTYVIQRLNDEEIK